MKQCNRCKQFKDESLFGKKRINKSGTIYFKTECRKCASERAREWRIKNNEKAKIQARKWRHNNKDKVRQYCKQSKEKRRFKNALLLSKYVANKQHHKPCNATETEIKEKFNGVCCICGYIESKEKLCLDHCHKTGKFRGWLCRRCNRVLGMTKESVELYKKYIKYVQSASVSN